MCCGLRSWAHHAHRKIKKTRTTCGSWVACLSILLWNELGERKEQNETKTRGKLWEEKNRGENKENNNEERKEN